MFSASRVSGLKLALVAGLALAAASSAALADRGRGGGDRDRGRGGDRTRVNLSVNVNSRGHGHSHYGHSYGGYRGGYDRHHHHGGWNRGSSFSFSIGSGGYCPPPYRPVYVAPAPVIIAPAPVVVAPAPVYVDRPVYVERPVYTAPVYTAPAPVVVERQVVVEKPVVVERQVVVERPVVQQVQTVPVAQTVEPTASEVQGQYQDRELGDAYLRMADFDNASRVYRRYMTAWSGDGTVARNLGLALVGRGDLQEGFRAFVSGYSTEPTLYDRPLRVVDMGGAYGFQRLLDAAGRSADSTNTPEGWFTVAVLQHWAGNRESALNASQRAKAAGLDSATLDKLTLMLSKQS